MKKIFIFVVMSIFLSAGLVIIEDKPAFARRKKAKVVEKEKQKPVDLNNTKWGVKIIPMAGIGITRKDTLVFKDKKFLSDNFKLEGFTPTNYTLSVKDNGITVFETMQTKDKKTVFWRGELRGEVLRGIISARVIEGKTDDYSFIGPKTEDIEVSAETPAATETETPVQTEEIKETTTETKAGDEKIEDSGTAEKTEEIPNKEEKPKKKKKKRWWRR